MNALDRILEGMKTYVEGDRRYRRCPHGLEHPNPYRPVPHSCCGCFCEGERDRAVYGWPHDTTPKEQQ